MIYRFLTHPAYGGAYAYGKTEQVGHYDGAVSRKRCRHKPREQWLALIPEAHDGYIDWQRFQQIGRALAANSGRLGTGAAKQGMALLAGLLRCHRCGRKLTVRYTGRAHDVLRYSCMRGWMDQAELKCIAFGGIAVDEAIGRQVLRIVEPASVEAAVLAETQQQQHDDEVCSALERDLQAARYAVQRAGKQFDACDPDKRKRLIQTTSMTADEGLERLAEISRQCSCQ
jgi:hypothetical protein